MQLQNCQAAGIRGQEGFEEKLTITKWSMPLGERWPFSRPRRRSVTQRGRGSIETKQRGLFSIRGVMVGRRRTYQSEARAPTEMLIREINGVV